MITTSNVCRPSFPDTSLMLWSLIVSPSIIRRLPLHGAPSTRHLLRRAAPQRHEAAAQRTAGIRARLAQVLHRVDRRAVAAHLEVQVRTRGVTGVAAVADDLPRAHGLPG